MSELTDKQKEIKEKYFDPVQKHILVCHDKYGCSEHGAKAVLTEIRSELDKKGIRGNYKTNTMSCVLVNEMNCTLGHYFGPKGVTVAIYPDGVMYPNVTQEDVPEVVERTIMKGEIIDRLLLVKLPYQTGLKEK